MLQLKVSEDRVNNYLQEHKGISINGQQVCCIVSPVKYGMAHGPHWV
jgi:hypothetical protein